MGEREEDTGTWSILDIHYFQNRRGSEQARERETTHPHAREVIHMHKSQQRVIEMIKYFFPSFVSPLHFLSIGIHIFQLKKKIARHLKHI